MGLTITSALKVGGNWVEGLEKKREKVLRGVERLKVTQIREDQESHNETGKPGDG